MARSTHEQLKQRQKEAALLKVARSLFPQPSVDEHEARLKREPWNTMPSAATLFLASLPSALKRRVRRLFVEKALPIVAIVERCNVDIKTVQAILQITKGACSVCKGGAVGTVMRMTGSINMCRKCQRKMTL